MHLAMTNGGRFQEVKKGGKARNYALSGLPSDCCAQRATLANHFGGAMEQPQMRVVLWLSA
jgi:hypothetical protein